MNLAMRLVCGILYCHYKDQTIANIALKLLTEFTLNIKESCYCMSN